MEPMQIASFAAAIAKRGIFQTAVTVISAALYFGVLCEALVHDLLQGLSFEAVYNLHPNNRGIPSSVLDIAAVTALILSVPRPRFPLWEGPPT